MAKEKPKKGGMVLIIGMGAKPPKSKEKVKKADEEPKKKVRSRGGGKGSENKTRNMSRFLNFKRMIKKDPAHLDKVLKKTRMSKEQLEQFIRLKTGANSFEEAMQQRQDLPGMISEAARMLAGNRGNDPLKNEKLATMLKKKGIPISEFKKYVEKNPFWELEGDFQNLVDRLQGFKGGSTRAARNERPRGRKQREQAEVAQEQMAQEADEEARDEQGYTDHELQTMTNILSASMPLEQARTMAARYLQSGRHTQSDHTKSPFGYPGYDKILQGTGKHPSTFANLLTQLSTQRGYPGRHVEGSISAQPSTLFSQPRTVGVKLSSPQEEEAEDAVDYGKSSDNPMTLAWAILKGNPEMKDARGQNIDQPAAAMYDNLAAAKRGLLATRRAVPGDTAPFGEGILSDRRLASALTHAQMQQPDPQHGPNYGVERQDRHEVEHPNKPSKVDAILEALERRGGDDPDGLASESRLREARQQDEKRDFGDMKYPMFWNPDPQRPTDPKMKPGNVMDLM